MGGAPRGRKQIPHAHHDLFGLTNIYLHAGAALLLLTNVSRISCLFSEPPKCIDWRVENQSMFVLRRSYRLLPWKIVRIENGFWNTGTKHELSYKTSSQKLGEVRVGSTLRIRSTPCRFSYYRTF